MATIFPSAYIAEFRLEMLHIPGICHFWSYRVIQACKKHAKKYISTRQSFVFFMLKSSPAWKKYTTDSSDGSDYISYEML